MRSDLLSHVNEPQRRDVMMTGVAMLIFAQLGAGKNGLISVSLMAGEKSTPWRIRNIPAERLEES